MTAMHNDAIEGAGDVERPNLQADDFRRISANCALWIPISGLAM
jgi:hypothetical protein